MRCFGKNTLNYIKGLADGHIDYLPRLPEHLIVYILRFLDLEDLSRVACLSKMFRKVRHPPNPAIDLEGLSRVACLSKMLRKVRYPPSHPAPVDLEDLSRVACLSKMFRRVRYPLSTTRPGESVQGGLSVQDVEEGKIPTLHH